MGWKHIVLEASCLYEENDENKNLKCCKGNISIHCLTYNQNGHQICPNLLFGKSRTSVVATDNEGLAVDYSTFWTDENLSSEEWIIQENLWLAGQRKRLNNE